MAVSAMHPRLKIVPSAYITSGIFHESIVDVFLLDVENQRKISGKTNAARY
jgi:hypothetical protein